MKEIRKEELNEWQFRLIEHAEKATADSYSPYSKFSVGSAILSQDGKIVTGANVENAAYGSSICAERAAILHANAVGIRKVKAIAVVCKPDGKTKKYIPGAPCGSCRQMINELACLSGKDIEIIMSTPDKSKIILSRISELLPMAFGPGEVGLKK